MRTLSIGRKFLSAAMSAVIAASALCIPAMHVNAAGSITVGKSLTTKEGTNAYRGQTADLATSGLESISVYVTIKGATSDEVDVSYGFGIGIAADPWWIEMDHGKFTQTPADPDDTGTSVKVPTGVSTPIKVDVSGIKNIKYETGQYAGEFEFRNYYVGGGGTLTLDKIVANDTAKPVKPTTPSGNAEKSGAYSVVDNKDGTYTFRSTLTGTVDDLNATLTAGKDEDSYLDENGDSTWTEGDPINSRKIKYTDFGLPTATSNTKVTVESFDFSVSSKTDMDTLMYGIGLNVEYKSPADTEYWLTHCTDPDTKKGYWYNEHGTDEDGNPIDTSDVEIDNLCAIGEGTTVKDCGGWADVTWVVPDDIKEYVTTTASNAVSFQFWYGDNSSDGYTALKSVTLESASCTYTVEKTVPVSDLADLKQGTKLTQGDDDTNTASISFKDFDLAENDKVQAVLFKLTCPSAIKKLVFGVTISDKASSAQYTQLQYAILDAGTSQEILVIIPDDVDPDVLYGNLGFGYYYGADKNDKLVNSITLDKVTLYYDKAPEVTTTTTITTTTTTTTTTTPAPASATLWGDADLSDTVDVSDAVLTARFIAEDQEAVILDQGKINADVSHKNGIDSQDTIMILKYIAKLIPYSSLEP